MKSFGGYLGDQEMIRDDDELGEMARRAGECLAEIQSYLGRKPHAQGRVRFPRGFIRTAASIRSELPPTRNPTHGTYMKENISYALITADVLRWLLIRTDLKGLAQQMLIKETICIFGNVCDGLMEDFLYGRPGPKKTFKQRTERLSDLGVIDDEAKGELDWLWERRCDEHLLSVKVRELDHYTPADYERARRAYAVLLAALREQPS